MRERALALLGGVVSLVLVLMILTPLGQPRPPGPSLPTTVDQGDAGLKAFRLWLDEQGVATVSHRRPLSELPDGRGSLLVITLPGKTGLSEAEPEALEAWVARGNHLLVLVAYGDAPAWRELSERNTETALAWLDLELAGSAPVRETDAVDSGGDGLVLDTMVEHPLTRGVSTVHVPPPAQPLAGLAPQPEDRLRLALLGRNGQPAFWWLPSGQGTVLLSAYSALFSHDGLDKADNARLAANVVNQTVAADGRAIFDDFRFGMDGRYDPEAFFADPRLHYTLAFVVAFWLLYVIGHSARLGPPRQPPEPSTARRFAEGVAGLLARRIPRTELRERLWRHLVSDLRRRYGAADPWAVLEASPRLDAADLETLRRVRQRIERGETINDERYARLLNRIREATL